MIRAAQIRLDRGLTVSAVSEATGLARKTVVRLEEGRDVLAPTLKALADFYGVSATSLLLPAEAEDVAA